MNMATISWSGVLCHPSAQAPLVSRSASFCGGARIAPRAAMGDDVGQGMEQMLNESRRPGPSSGSSIKVVLNGSLSSELSKGAVRALSSARGLDLAGAINSDPGTTGQDLGQLVGLSDPLELPVMSDPVMLFASVAQARSSAGVYLDLTGNPDAAFENVRQAVAFGLSCVIGHCVMSRKQLSTLVDFCDKASMGCLVAPTLSIGELLLQQAALSMAFHYGHVDILETRPPVQNNGVDAATESQGPSGIALAIANELNEIGRTFNGGDTSTDELSRGAVVGDGVRIHTIRHPGPLSTLDLRFAAPGQSLSLCLSLTDVRAYMPGLLLAVRRAPRLKGLVYGLEKLL